MLWRFNHFGQYMIGLLSKRVGNGGVMILLCGFFGNLGIDSMRLNHSLISNVWRII